MVVRLAQGVHARGKLYDGVGVSFQGLSGFDYSNLL